MVGTPGRVGQKLGNYQLMQLLGQGGFAEVYLGEHIYLKTPVAIKVLQAHLSSAEDRESFTQEAQIVARLLHPHIIRVTDFGLDNETPFLVMDYAPNGTLRTRHPRGTRLPLATVIDYTKQVAGALQYAHNQKLVHRDIKPENMLLGRNNELLLSDFGIALVAQSSRHQSLQNVVGTVAYMAPEQIQGHPRFASDQYALAIVVYEWLSGQVPFRGSFTELCAQHVFSPPPSLQQVLPELPTEVDNVLQIALAKDPKQRFGSIEVFASALEQASQTRTVRPSSRSATGQQQIVLRTTPAPRPSFPSTQQATPVISAPFERGAQPRSTEPAQYRASGFAPSRQSAQQSLVTPSSPHIPPGGAQYLAAPYHGQLPYPPVPYTQPAYAHHQWGQLSTHKPSMWRFGLSQLLALIVGVALYNLSSHVTASLPFAGTNHFIQLNNLTLLFFSTAFGPWVGLLVAFFGDLSLPLLSYPHLEFVNGALQVLSTSTYSFTTNWLFVGVDSLVGFLAGLTGFHAIYRQGNSSLFGALLAADLMSTILLFTADIITYFTYTITFQRDITRFLFSSTIPNIIFCVVLLPILLLLYSAIAPRNRDDF